MDRRVKGLFTRKDLLLLIIFFMLFLGTGYYTFFTPNYYEGHAPVQFEIKKGETFSEVAENLYEYGIIPGKNNFKIAGFIYGAQQRIRAARYHIPNGLSYIELLDLFLKGDADFLRTVKIRDGLSIKWMAYRLEQDVFVDSSEFVRLANDRKFVDSLGLKVASLEGYLLTGPREIYERSSAKEAIEVLYNSFTDFISEYIPRADSIGFSVHEILTLASIVKGETNDSSEMPIIAGVYHNRLKRGMKLQADPTIQFLQEKGWKRLLYKDLLINSPYNTYKYYGLPPGPINNPGKAAILAALYPTDHQYYFFVADGNGGHNFSRTYTEHLKKVREFRRLIRSRK